MYSVILCGGSGTRLWPLSRKNFPKQFLRLTSDKSLIQETYLRVRNLMRQENIYFVTNKENYFNVFNQIKEIEPGFSQDQILTEPASLNTALAMTYAVKHLAEKVRIDLDAPIVFLPADHYIGKEEKYLGILKHAMENLAGHVGTIGITPNKPETGYGYIRKGEKLNSCHKVLEFKEKPDRETAAKYLESGQYVWNSGMYLFSIRTFIRELKAHAPEIYALMTRLMEEFLEKFSTMPSISIDYAISEKSQNVVVFEGEFGWNDIGSFDSLAEIFSDKFNPKHLSLDSKNTYVHTDSNKLIATLGVEDINVIEAADSILVYKRGRGEDVKKVVDKLKEKGLKELEHNLMVHRPWGKYEVLIDGDAHQVKRITVYPGAKLSLQAYFHRAEHWIVVKGTARIMHGEKEIMLQENESTFIPKLTRHRLENPGKINLELIEVQTGSYLGEDDIIRFEDVYNRG